ncbi:MAG: choice-of-anchor D domain-containing protein [Thioploca sp.]|nr:choice-of-anchor D domain-containing protein [Thioploca sp.]
MKYCYLLIYIGFCLLVNLANSGAASACIQPTIIVKNTNDNGPDSLRQAILDSCDGNTTTIDFNSNLANQIIRLYSELIIDLDINIINSKAKNLIISGDSDGDGHSDTQVFNVGMGGGLTLENITIADGIDINGGGIYIESGTKPVIIQKSTFLNNEATGNGGAIYIGTRQVTIINSTFVNNGASNQGGAIYGNDGSITEMINNTLFQNTAAVEGGGIAASSGSTLLVSNTIIANNTGGDCSSSATPPLANDTNNFFSDKSCDHSDSFDGDPKLGVLQNNGGFTQTLALSSGSSAIDAGDLTVCGDVTEDQRGFTRTASSPCDIGAVEAISLCDVQSDIPKLECNALIDFYDKTNGPNWNDDFENNWKVTPTPCDWTGIMCDNGYVIEIAREGKNLSGKLPPSLAALTNLKGLKLNGNQLNGVIPSNLNELTHLEQLHLHNNQFSGPIPINLSSLNSLTELFLQNNQLDGEVPPTLIQLTNLNALNLDYNKLIADPTKTELIGFLKSKNPDGLKTQTIHPLNVAATALSQNQIKLTWTPISYTGDGGYYRAKCDTTSGKSNRSIQVQTANKSADSITIDNLSAGTKYYCVVEAYTPDHGEQQNKLTSLESPEIAVITLTPPLPPDQPPPPVIPPENTTLDLGSSVIGKSIQVNFNILKNKTIEIVNFSLSGDYKGDFDILSPDFPVTINSQGLTLSVQCTPSHRGPHTALLKLIPANSDQPISQYSLKCSGKQPAKYMSSPAPNSTIVMGHSLINQPISKTFSIREDGEEDLQVNFIAITGTAANYFEVTAPAFPVTLADGSPEQVVTVTCTPLAVGDYTATLQLSSNDITQATPTYTLKCKGILPGTIDFISTPLPEQPIDFGASLVGQPITVNLNIANEGNLDLVVDSTEITGDDADSFKVLKLQLPLVLNQNQDNQIIMLQCLPSKMGIDRAILHLETNDPDYPTVNYPLTCSGLSQAVGYASTPPPGSLLDLGSTPIGKAVTIDLIITETGNLPLEVNGATISGAQADNFQIIKPPIPLILADGASATTITVQCTPTQVGTHTAELQLHTNDDTIPSPVYSLQCQGTTTIPLYDSKPAPSQLLDLGSGEIGQPLTGSITVSEQGTATLEVLNHQLSGKDADNFHIIQGGAPFSLLDGNPEHTLVIQCLPQQLGPHTARLTLDTNAPDNLTVYYDLSCTGLPAINPPSPQIILSYDRVYEDSLGGTFIGRLSTLNSDSQIQHYTLLDDANGLFTVQDDELRLVAMAQLDFETTPQYTIVVQNTDDQGISFNQNFTIYVNDVHESEFLGKVLTETGKVGKQVVIDAAEKITVIGYIKPSQKHLGQLVNLIMTYYWMPYEGGQSLTVPVTVAQQIPLKTDMEVTLFEGRLIGLAGFFEVSLGYQLEAGQNLSAAIATLEVRPNRLPTQIQLSNWIIAENTPPDTVIGWFTTTDPDQTDYFRYGLIDNTEGYFKIVGNQLRTNNFHLDYERSTNYPITVRSVDSGGAYVDENFIIQVTDQPATIVNLYLNRNEITENSSSGTLVGRLWNDDDEPGIYTYEIVTTPSPFILEGDLLLVAEDIPLDFETQPFYSVAVRSQQRETGQSIEKILTIKVLNEVDVAYVGEVYNLKTGQPLDPSLIQATDDIMVKVQLFPEQTHYGQTVELFSVALWRSFDETRSMTYMLENNTWKEWNGDLSTLAHIQPLTLSEDHHNLLLWQGQLTHFSGGQFSIFTGYQLVTGELIYTINPFKISVQ